MVIYVSRILVIIFVMFFVFIGCSSSSSDGVSASGISAGLDIAAPLECWGGG